MTEPVCALDLARLRRDRVAKLDDAMEAAGVDTLVLCAQQNVSYATGTRVPAADHVRASWWRAVAVLEPLVARDPIVVLKRRELRLAQESNARHR